MYSWKISVLCLTKPITHLTFKAQVYITGIGGVAHTHPLCGNHLLYRNRLLIIWNEFHELATSSDLLSSLVYHLSTFNTLPHLKDLAGTIIRGEEITRRRYFNLVSSGRLAEELSFKAYA